MSWQKIITCDGDNCKQQQKKETNNWWQAHLFASTTIIMPFNDKFYDKDGVLDYSNSDAHFCGIECATKWVSKQLLLIIETNPNPETAAMLPQQNSSPQAYDLKRLPKF